MSLLVSHSLGNISDVPAPLELVVFNNDDDFSLIFHVKNCKKYRYSFLKELGVLILKLRQQTSMEISSNGQSSPWSCQSTVVSLSELLSESEMIALLLGGTLLDILCAMLVLHFFEL